MAASGCDVENCDRPAAWRVEDGVDSSQFDACDRCAEELTARGRYRLAGSLTR